MKRKIKASTERRVEELIKKGLSPIKIYHKIHEGRKFELMAYPTVVRRCAAARNPWYTKYMIWIIVAVTILVSGVAIYLAGEDYQKSQQGISTGEYEIYKNIGSNQ